MCSGWRWTDADVVRRCSLSLFARARIALAEKGLEYEVLEIDLSDRPQWIYEKNPTGRVPVIEEDAWILPESSVILEFLEERYPEPPLLPPDPADRALARVWIFRHDDFTKPYYALRREEEGAAEKFDEQLAKLEEALSRQAWLTGAEYGLADIAYVPWVLRARDMLGVSLDAFPAVREWLARLEERPAVAREVETVAAL